MWLKNAWYAAGWSTEITRTPCARTILETPILLYRREDGSPVVMENACAHRKAPLSLGTLHGDDIQCGYPGLRFDGAGTCVLDPHGDGRISSGMSVRVFPIVERHGMVWIWMGDADRAHESEIPDFSFHTDPAFAFVGGIIEMNAHYEVITDDLLDLSHVQYRHRSLLGGGAVLEGELELDQRGTTVYANRFMPSTAPIPLYQHMLAKAHGPAEPSEVFDQWQYVRWDAPAHIVIDQGVTQPGGTRASGAMVYGTGILTPIDETHTYYFWGVARSYALDDAEEDQFWRDVVKLASSEQDQPMIEAQQRKLETTSLPDAAPVLFGIDRAPQRVRKVLEGLIARDAAPQSENPSTMELWNALRNAPTPVAPCV